MSPHSYAQFEIGSGRNFVYLLIDERSKATAFIDPQRDLSLPLAHLKTHGLTLSMILLTHTHHDHIAGVPELLRMFPELPLRAHDLDLHRLDANARGRASRIVDGERILLGDTSVEVLHTPGHSAGECCYFVDGAPSLLFTGDTVFIRDCGRTDFEDGSNEQMFASLQRIKKLPPATVILPGHHYAPELTSTLERELRDSAPMRCKSVEELEALP